MSIHLDFGIFWTKTNPGGLTEGKTFLVSTKRSLKSKTLSVKIIRGLGGAPKLNVYKNFPGITEVIYHIITDWDGK